MSSYLTFREEVIGSIRRNFLAIDRSGILTPRKPGEIRVGLDESVLYQGVEVKSVLNDLCLAVDRLNYLCQRFSGAFGSPAK